MRFATPTAREARRIAHDIAVAGFRHVPVVVPLAVPDDILSAEEAPHVTTNDTTYEVVRSDIDGHVYYALVGPRGATNFMHQWKERGVTTGMLYACNGKQDVLDERQETALYVEDGEGGLTQVRRGTQAFRDAMNEALVAAGRDPLPDPQLSDPEGPRLEIPDSVEGWKTVAAELVARLETCMHGAPVPLAVPGRFPDGDVTLDVRVTPPLLSGGTVHGVEVAGTLFFQGDAYRVTGSPYGPRVMHAYRVRRAPEKAAREVAKAVRQAYNGPGPHADIRALQVASAKVARYLTVASIQGNRTAPPELREARDSLLELGIRTLDDDPRDLAHDMVVNEFKGSVQELRDVARALLGQ